MFMQDNATSHSAKKTTEYLQQLGFSRPRIMKWPVCSPDLNKIENICNGVSLEEASLSRWTTIFLQR